MRALKRKDEEILIINFINLYGMRILVNYSFVFHLDGLQKSCKQCKQLQLLVDTHIHFMPLPTPAPIQTNK